MSTKRSVQPDGPPWGIVIWKCVHKYKVELFLKSQTSRKGTNQEALNLSTLIDLYTQLISERLVVTDAVMQKMHLNSLKK